LVTGIDGFIGSQYMVYPACSLINPFGSQNNIANYRKNATPQTPDK